MVSEKRLKTEAFVKSSCDPMSKFPFLNRIKSILRCLRGRESFDGHTFVGTKHVSTRLWESRNQ